MRVLVIVMMLSASVAIAQTPVEMAKAHFKQGRAYQDVGEYGKAAAEYEAAYAIDPRPEMLFNIAQAHRLAGDKPTAVDYFKKYLDARPSGSAADEARGHVATLTKAIEDERRAQNVPDVNVPAQGVPPTTNPRTSTAEPARLQTATERGPRSLRIAGMASLGAGIVAAAAGIKLGFDARTAADDISSRDSGAWTLQDHERFDAGVRADRNMKIAYVGAGVLAVGAVVLYYLGARTRQVQSTTASLQLAPFWDATSAGLAVGGSL